MGNAPIDIICASDAGEIVHQVFLHPEEYKGRWVPIASDRLTLKEIADLFAKKLGRKFVPGKVSNTIFQLDLIGITIVKMSEPLLGSTVIWRPTRPVLFAKYGLGSN